MENLREEFKKESGYDCYAYDENKQGESRSIGFCENYVEWLESKVINLDKNTFEEAVKPAIRYLLKNHNPHTKIYIDYSISELLEGVKSCNLNNEVPD